MLRVCLLLLLCHLPLGAFGSVEALYDACLKGEYEKAKSILEADPKLVNHEKDGVTPFDQAAFHRMLRATRASYLGKVKICKLLIDMGADVKTRKNGLSHLFSAEKLGKKEIAKLLRQHGCKLNDEEKFRLAIFDRDIKKTETHLESNPGYVGIDYSHGQMPLFSIVREGTDVDLAQLLIDYGADVNEVDIKGNTGLGLTARHGSHEMLKLLLANGADIDAADGHKRTPLHLAAMLGKARIAGILLQSGADFFAKDNIDRTPYEMAVHFERENVVTVLRRWAEKKGIELPTVKPKPTADKPDKAAAAKTP